MSNGTVVIKGRSGKVLFEGTVTDGEKYLADNFPRIHSDEAGPDFTFETDPPGQVLNLPETMPQPEKDEVETPSEESTDPNEGDEPESGVGTHIQQ